MWDVFSIVAADAGLSEPQEAALFADNAAAFYRLEPVGPDGR